MNFLKYIELSAENLQFFLWYRDYSKRFDALPASEKNLSPEWTGEKATNEKAVFSKARSVDAAAILRGTDFASESSVVEHEKTDGNPFFTPPRTPIRNSDERRDGGTSLDTYQDSMMTGGKVDHAQRATEAFQSAGLKWQPCKF